MDEYVCSVLTKTKTKNNSNSNTSSLQLNSILPEQKDGSRAFKPTVGVKILPQKLENSRSHARTFKNITK
jgi:hypothetical protein